MNDELATGRVEVKVIRPEMVDGVDLFEHLEAILDRQELAQQGRVEKVDK